MTVSPSFPQCIEGPSIHSSQRRFLQSCWNQHNWRNLILLLVFPFSGLASIVTSRSQSSEYLLLRPSLCWLKMKFLLYETLVFKHSSWIIRFYAELFWALFSNSYLVRKHLLSCTCMQGRESAILFFKE